MVWVRLVWVGLGWGTRAQCIAGVGLQESRVSREPPGLVLARRALPRSVSAPRGAQRRKLTAMARRWRARACSWRAPFRSNLQPRRTDSPRPRQKTAAATAPCPALPRVPISNTSAARHGGMHAPCRQALRPCGSGGVQRLQRRIPPLPPPIARIESTPQGQRGAAEQEEVEELQLSGTALFLVC